MRMRWAVLFVVLITNLNTNAFELNPICHEYYETIQTPGLTYEDVGRIAEAMYHKQCWPALQETPPAQTAGGLPSCEYLAEHLINTSDNIRKLFDVRPMRESDCAIDGTFPGMSYGEWGTTSFVYLVLSECHLLVNNPAHLADQRPGLGLRPVNCRGKILYANGSKSGFYFYMEQYPDGDRGVWGANAANWGW